MLCFSALGILFRLASSEGKCVKLCKCHLMYHKNRFNVKPDAAELRYSPSIYYFTCSF